MNFGGGVVPNALPRHELTPVAIKLWGNISTDTGDHPSALREATTYFDRGIAVNAEGLAACHPFTQSQSAGDLRKACRDAVVGSGRANFEIASPEEIPTAVSGSLIAFNGGVRGSITTLYVVAFVKAPAPSPIVIQVKITKIDEGRFGLRAVAKIPPLAGGDGSLLSFNLKLKRLFRGKGAPESYLMARCPDGRLDTESSALFKNEAETPGVAPTTVAKGTVVLPCRPTG